MFAASMMLADTTPAAATAAVPTPPPAVSSAPVAKKEDKPRLICRTEPVTGSMFPKKTCYTSDQYSQRQQDERQNLEKMQNQLGLRSN